MPLKTGWKLTQATLKAWYEDNSLQMGAGLAYYAVFSIPPLLIITLAVMGLFDSGNNLGYIEHQMAPLIGENAANAISVMMKSVHSSRHGLGGNARRHPHVVYRSVGHVRPVAEFDERHLESATKGWTPCVAIS